MAVLTFKPKKQNTIFVDGLIALSILVGFVASTYDVSMPDFEAIFLKYRLVPPYMSSIATTWSPLRKDFQVYRYAHIS